MPVPASPVQRLLAGGIDVLLVTGVSCFLPVSAAGRVLCAGLVLVVLVAAQAVTGAGPGGAVVGMRLHRVSHDSGPPGAAAVGRAGLMAMAGAATLGTAPLIMVMRAEAPGMRRTWFDRISGALADGLHPGHRRALRAGGRRGAPGPGP